ncbi:MAG: DUF2878 family protein [Candidatus Nanoarchaeia archaeon]|nr:DUF2878 family protein [Candidatus Nanoarchaeia archaeon]
MNEKKVVNKNKDRDLKKYLKIIYEAIPVIIMVILIALIKNDYFLSLIYIIILIASLYFKYEKKDYLIFIFGFLIMTLFETLFIQTGVEVFNRKTLFGIMPLWLPILWGYGFIAIKRSIKILNL